jgi:hypothetical protein
MASPRNYDMTAYPVQVAVRSQSDGAAVHMVTLPYCDCADFTNRKGRIADSEGGKAVTVCKHLLRALELAGWHQPEPGAAGTVTYNSLTRARAVTLLTSAYLSSALTEQLLTAAVGAATSPSIGATADLVSGPVLVKYDPQTRRYTVTLPESQPVAASAAFPVG